MPNFELLTLLATLMHRALCTKCHEGVCGWYYEQDLIAPWDRVLQHNQWMQRADRVVQKNPDLTLQQVQATASQFGAALKQINSWHDACK